MSLADRIGLTAEQDKRAVSIEEAIERRRAGIAVWHRLLERRRVDCKTGLHPIRSVVRAEPTVSGDQGTLTVREPEPPDAPVGREPFYLRSEDEARALLVRCLGYLTDDLGERLAFDKGIGQKDKMAEWLLHEIDQTGGAAFIRSRRPHVFGIELRMTDGRPM